ncbi:MAG: septum formation initiator family protein [Muribaculaceae bacterium]
MSLPLVIIVVFLVIILFFHENSYIKSLTYGQTISEMKQEIQENIDSAKYYERKVQELNTDPESLEKLAREQYHMKSANEDIYITNIK